MAQPVALVAAACAGTVASTLVAGTRRTSAAVRAARAVLAPGAALGALAFGCRTATTGKGADSGSFFGTAERGAVGKGLHSLAVVVGSGFVVFAVLVVTLGFGFQLAVGAGFVGALGTGSGRSLGQCGKRAQQGSGRKEHLFHVENLLN
jgi:hypothetical protein